jgi:diguanylate cyclase (GGDEF)-like protein
LLTTLECARRQTDTPDVNLRRARYDDLTGLPTRNTLTGELDVRLADALCGGVWPAVLFIDLDRFKHLNDALGHTVGDDLLCAAARRILDAVGDDDLVARLGGDEFLVLTGMSASSPDDALDLAEAIRSSFEEPFELGSAEVYLTASIGVAVAHRHMCTSVDLVRMADLAMYRAKAAGRNLVRIASDDLRREAEERAEIEYALRGAIANGDMQVVYQPIIDLATGSLTGFEALARWHHPTLGHVPPDRFVRIAEEAGLIVALGRRMIDLALRDAATWRREAGRDISVSVNVSALELVAGSHLSNIRTALARHDMPAHLLIVELTESILISDTQLALSRLESLRNEGVRVSIDDFGTGYSSLAYLRRFPFDQVKVDREFIAGLDATIPHQRIVRAITEIASEFGCEVVAEGVETDGELQAVERMGCDLAQGHLLGRPVSAAEALLLAVSSNASPLLRRVVRE